MGKKDVVGLTRQCPTVTLCVNGKEVRALLDTQSEVTTVTERWVRENMQHANLPSLTQVTLKAGNGLEISYSELIFEELKLLGQSLQNVPGLWLKSEVTQPPERESVKYLLFWG